MLSSSEPDDEHISRNDRILKADRIHFFNGAGERTKVPDDLRIRTFEYNITRTRTARTSQYVDRQPDDFAVTGTGFSEAGTDLKEAGNNGLCNKRLCRCKIGLCSSRNAREKENQNDSAAHQALCPGVRRGTQQKTREPHEKTEGSRSRSSTPPGTGNQDRSGNKTEHSLSPEQEPDS